MRFLTLLLLLGFPLFMNSQQIKSGEITYRFQLDFHPNEQSENSNSKGNATLINMIENSRKELKEVKGILLFNENTSFFHKEVPMENDYNPSLNISLTLLGLKGEGIYIKKREDIVYHNLEEFGHTFLVKEQKMSPSEWTITKTTKKIGDYLVYMATTTKKVVNSKGEFSFPVIAWFAPSIPFSYGPLDYNGLPGLILELKINSNFPSTYSVEKINLSKESVDIEKPEGKVVTQKQFQAMVDKAMQNLRSN